MNKPSIKGLEQYAAKPVLIFSGSILVLSVALNNIGFKEVIDAWAKSIAANIEVNECKPPELYNQVTENTKLIEQLKVNSHKPK